VLHFSSRRSISGELVLRGKLAWLRLRIDGKEVHSSTTGVDFENLDELFVAAVPAVMDKIRPYLVAASLYKVDPKKAAQKADYIIAHLPASDLNVHWSYVLKGNFFSDQKDDGRAEEAYRKAISLDRYNLAAHFNYGILLHDRGDLHNAISEFRVARAIDPKDADVHVGYANVLFDQNKIEDAVAEYRLAIELDPKSAIPHINYGTTLFVQGKLDAAAAEYRVAIELDPKSSAAHSRLGLILRDQGKLDDAIKEFRDAVEADPNDTATAGFLKLALQDKYRSMANDVPELPPAESR
jgi:tetratricopeptide (TPR) repeat protein